MPPRSSVPHDEDDPMTGPSSSFMDRILHAEDDDDDIAMGMALPVANPLTNPLAPEETPLQKLIRHWQNERHAPDILPGQELVLGTLLDHIRRQSNTVQLLRSDPDSSEDEHFRIMLAQTEIERVKFIVRSYIRTRLFKVEKYARHIMNTLEIQERLSQTELNHAKRFAQIVENHFQVSVLQSLPPDQRGLNDEAAFVPPMIPAPDTSRAVFVHAREDCPPVRLPDGNSLTIKKGHIVLTPYAVVEQLLAIGNVDLI